MRKISKLFYTIFHYIIPKFQKILRIIKGYSICLECIAVEFFGNFKNYFIVITNYLVTLDSVYNWLGIAVTDTDDCISFHKKPPAVLDF